MLLGTLTVWYWKLVCVSMCICTCVRMYTRCGFCLLTYLVAQSYPPPHHHLPLLLLALMLCRAHVGRGDVWIRRLCTPLTRSHFWHMRNTLLESRYEWYPFHDSEIIFDTWTRPQWFLWLPRDCAVNDEEDIFRDLKLGEIIEKIAYRLNIQELLLYLWNKFKS